MEENMDGKIDSDTSSWTEIEIDDETLDQSSEEEEDNNTSSTTAKTNNTTDSDNYESDNDDEDDFEEVNTSDDEDDSDLDDDNDDEEEDDDSDEDETSEKDSDEEESEETQKKPSSRAEKRIRDLVAKNKQLEAEKQAETAKLQEQITKLSKSQKSTEKAFATDKKATLEDQIKSLELSYERAVEAGDAKQQAAAMAAMQSAQVELKATDVFLSNITDEDEGSDSDGQKDTSSTPQHTTQQNTNQVTRESVIAQMPDRAQEWAEENEWFVQNRQMTATTLYITQDLEAEGFDPNDDDFYDELDERLREQYPRRFHNDDDESSGS